MSGFWRFMFRALILTCVWLPSAHATISCTSSAPGFTANYTSGTTASVQESMQMTCSRTASDPTNFTVSVWMLDGNPQVVDGCKSLRNSGCHQFFKAPSSTIWAYYATDSACSNYIYNNGAGSKNGPPLTFTFTAVGTSQTQTVNFWVCIANTNSGNGTYTQTRTITTIEAKSGATTLTINYSPPPTVTDTIVVSPICTVTSQPSNITLNYHSKGPLVSGSTTVGVTCSGSAPTLITVNPTSGTLAGVSYSLSLDTTSGTGTHTITATAVAGQSGSCVGSCTGNKNHSVTFTY